MLLLLILTCRVGIVFAQQRATRIIPFLLLLLLRAGSERGELVEVEGLSVSFPIVLVVFVIKARVGLLIVVLVFVFHVIAAILPQSQLLQTTAAYVLIHHQARICVFPLPRVKIVVKVLVTEFFVIAIAIHVEVSQIETTCCVSLHL